MKIPKNPIEEIEYLYPNTFFDKSHETNRNGTINQKKLPLALQLSFMDKIVIKIYEKYLFVFLTIYILCTILLIFANHNLGKLCLIILVCNIIFYKPSKQIYKAKVLIQKGINEFNNNYNFSAAMEAFKRAQIEYPQLSNELNDWIGECYRLQEKYYEALDFIQTHTVTSKRVKVFTLYTLTKRYEDALRYFEESYTEKEIKEHPAILMLPVRLLAGILNQPEKAIEYLEVKHSYIFKQFMNDELSYIKGGLAICYKLTGNSQKAKEIYQDILAYDPYNITAQKSYEEILNSQNTKQNEQ